MELILLALFFTIHIVLALIRHGIPMTLSVLAAAATSSLLPFRAEWIHHHVRAHPRWKQLWDSLYTHRIVSDLPETSGGDVDTPTIYAAFPHGLLPMGTAASVVAHGGAWTEATHRPVPVVLASSAFTRLPGVRPLANLFGITDASRAVFEDILLIRKRSVYVLPGGIKEMLQCRNDRLILYVDPEPPHIREHKGFLYIAYTNNVPVVPIFHLNQHALFHIWMPEGWGLQTMRTWSCRWLGYPFPSVFWPRRTQLTTYVGAPIQPSSHTTFDDFRNTFYRDLLRLPLDRNLPKDLVDYRQTLEDNR